MTYLLDDILDGMAGLDPRRGERGMVEGKRTSTPASRRAPVDLDALVLTDPRSGALGILMHWAGRIRRAWGIPGGKLRSMGSEAKIIGDYWDWASAQWPEMVSQLQALSDRLYEVRHGVKIRRCPVCGEPVRIDRFVAEHRACIDHPA